MIFYAEKIFIYAGSTLDKSISAIILGIVNFIATFVATVLIDRLGRKVKRLNISLCIKMIFQCEIKK